MADAQLIQIGGNYGHALNASASNFTLNANNDAIAWAFQPYSTDAITHLGFRYGARTGTPPTYLIQLEGLDGSGNPDATDVGGGSPTAVTFTPPADTSIDGLWQWKALTNSYTPSIGQELVGVIRYSSGTVDGSNNSSFTQRIASHRAGCGIGLYSQTCDAGAWTKSGLAMTFGWRTANGRYGYIAQSQNGTTASTAGHRACMYFTLSSSWASTFKLLGIDNHFDVGAAAGSTKYGVWNAAGTELQSITIDSDHGPSVLANTQRIIFNGPLATLSFGTKYYVGGEVVSGTIAQYGLNVAEAADTSCYPFGTSRGIATWNGSAWTETATVYPLCDLILDDITPPSGGSGGGMLVHPGLTGGVRG